MRDRLPLNERQGLYATIVDAADKPGLRACLLPAQLAWLATQAVPAVAPPSGPWRCWRQPQPTPPPASHTRKPDDISNRPPSCTSDPEEGAHLTLESGHAYERAGLLDRARERYASLITADNARTRARVRWASIGSAILRPLGSRPRWFASSTRSIASSVATVDTALRARCWRLAAARAPTCWPTIDRSPPRWPPKPSASPVQQATKPPSPRACSPTTTPSGSPGRSTSAGSSPTELAASGRRRSDPSLEAQGLLLRMVAELETGDPAYLATHWQFDAVADASRSPRWQFVAASRRGMIAALRADLATARAEIDAARALGERIGEPDAVGVWCDQRWQVARHAGDTDTLRSCLATVRDMGDPHWMIYEAMVAADLGDADRARWVTAPRRRARSALAAMGGAVVGRIQRRAGHRRTRRHPHHGSRRAHGA